MGISFFFLSDSSHKSHGALSFLRVLLAILFPPLAVIDQGCGSLLIVFILTLCGWVPGVIAALVILNNPGRFVLKHNSNAKKK